MRTIFQVHQDKALYSDIIRTKIHLASTPGLSCLNGSVCISRLFWHRFPFLLIPMIICPWIGVIIHFLKPSGGSGPVLSPGGSICRGWSQLQVIYRMAILMTILMPILMIILMVVVIKTMTMMIRGALKNMRFYWQ